MQTKHYPVTHTDAEWRKLLTAEQYDILRGHGTERPGSCALNYEKRAGTFTCAACGQTLFKSTCSSCHTLSAAHATGTIGPNLDMLRPPAAAVIATINSGFGRMPPHLLTGTSEQEVADYVAAVTAH